MKRLSWSFIKIRHALGAFFEFNRVTIRVSAALFAVSVIIYLALYPFNYYVVPDLPIRTTPSQVGTPRAPLTTQPAPSPDTPENRYEKYRDQFLEWPINVLTFALVFVIVLLVYIGGPPLLKVFVDLMKSIRG